MKLYKMFLHHGIPRLEILTEILHSAVIFMTFPLSSFFVVLNPYPSFYFITNVGLEGLVSILLCKVGR